MKVENFNYKREHEPLSSANVKIQYRNRKNSFEMKSEEDLFVTASDSIKIKHKVYKVKTEQSTEKSDTGSDISSQPSTSKQFKLVQSKRGIPKKKNPYQCPVCGKYCAALFLGKKHLDAHFKKLPVICALCGNMFVDKKQYLIHNVSHSHKYHKRKTILKSPLKTFECKICWNPFKTRDSLESHMKTHSNTFSCDLCPKYFNRKSTLTQHKITHFGPQFKCEICSKLFKSKSNRNRHELTHAQTNTCYFRCKLCQQKFCKTSSFVNHWFEHRGKMHFQCKLCRARFDKAQTLIHHCRNHFSKSSSRFQCGVCLLTYRNNDKLLDHVAKHVSDKDKKTLVHLIRCKICSKHTFGEAAFNRHLRSTHILKKPHTCQLCSQRFNADVSLLQHLVAHHDESDFMSCPFCKSKLFTKDTLQYHLDTKHSDLKESNALFADLDSRSVTDRSSVVCNICSSDYPNRDGLVEHMRESHVNVTTPLACVVCTRELPDRQSVIRHLMQEQGIDNGDYFKQCEVCRWNFFEENEFVTHCKRYHYLPICFEDYLHENADAKDEFDVVYKALEIREEKFEHSGFFDLC